jgi:hypothetical protein
LPELVTVGDRFVVRPLLPLLSAGGHIYVTALSQDEIRLFRGRATCVSDAGGSTPHQLRVGATVRCHVDVLTMPALVTSGTGQSADNLPAALEDAGYEPRRPDPGIGPVVLSNCPFHRLAQQFAVAVGGVNLQLLRGVADGTDDFSYLAELDAGPGSPPCTATAGSTLTLGRQSRRFPTPVVALIGTHEPYS